ncbi:MAG TPA: TIGR02996 domain-containing protein [Kofleriaceae bacterium]|nr:TIGR02996 domain-containing protein [Kofleriaceae bacterium]
MTGDELRAQIWQTPDDRALLAVYADWLLQHDDEARGRYIHLALLPDPTPAQVTERWALFHAHVARWMGPAAPHLSRPEDCLATPSFLGGARCTAESLAAGFDAICAVSPRLVLRLAPIWQPRARTLFWTLPLGRLYGLELVDDDMTWVDDPLFTGALPQLHGLQHLALSIRPGALTLDGWRAISQQLTTLASLELDLHATTDSWLEALVDSPLTRSLRHVALTPPHSDELRARIEQRFAAAQLTWFDAPVPE